MKLYEFYFSPTGGTKKAADILAAEMSQDIVTVDLTDYKTDFSSITLSQDDVALFAVPSFSGRVPETAVSRISPISGGNARAVLVCVYGNRAYEDTLIKLYDTVKQAGFRVTAAVSAIAEHSIARQFAAGRPDAQDQSCLKGFAEQICKKLSDGTTTEPQIPGNRPYRKAGGSGMVPKPTRDCINCGLCAEQCPVQAIDKTDSKKINSSACISCMRCIAVCPRSARKLNTVMQAAVNTMLKKACSGRKECELFL